jgi:hypothetical protein
MTSFCSYPYCTIERIWFVVNSVNFPIVEQVLVLARYTLANSSLLHSCQSEPAPTNAPSIGCSLMIQQAPTVLMLISSFTLITHFVSFGLMYKYNISKKIGDYQVIRWFIDR